MGGETRACGEARCVAEVEVANDMVGEEPWLPLAMFGHTFVTLY